MTETKTDNELIAEFRAWDGDDSRTHKDGPYIYVFAPWHPNATKRGFVKRHRLVLEQKLGYYLPRHSVVHHINGDKKDDRISNLEYHPDQKFHAKHHDSGKRNHNKEFVASDPVFSTIKFRLLNKNTGLFEIHTLGKLIKTTFRNSQFSFAGRFTGLHDKEGKEIYEGERIRFTINFSDERNRAYWSQDSFTGVVFWDHYKWSIKDVQFEKMHDQDYVFMMQDRQFDKDLLQRYCSIKKAEFSEVAYISIIGNIHQNP